MLAVSPTRLIRRSPAGPGLMRPLPGLQARDAPWTGAVSVLSAMSELDACADADAMLKRAVELARDRIGLERVSIYVCDRSTTPTLFRGSWGTGIQGETTDERSLSHELNDEDFEALCQLPAKSALWLYREDVPLYTETTDNSRVVGHGWHVVTPLLTAGELVGVMYNDAAMTRSAVDEGKQTWNAMFCSLLAVNLRSRQGPVPWRPLLGDESRFSLTVRRILGELNRDPLISGESLARRLAISPGHVARSFKSEVGISLVEYRNRLRLERFLSSVDRGSTNLLNAALDAGFGSYAQFHRVYRKLLGTTPRQHLATRKSPARQD